jgi:calcium-dependent protein kinase
MMSSISHVTAAANTTDPSLTGANVVTLEECHLDHAVFIRDSSSRNILERYRIDAKEFSSGAAGKVFHGKDSILRDRPVVIKRVAYKKKKDDSDLEFAYKLQQIKREVTIMKTLDHPNICKLFETYDDGEFLSFVMEECMGGELWERLEQGSGVKSEAVAAEIITQVSVALRYAASKKVAHRELKPENVCFASRDEDDNTVKVIDWGVGFIDGCLGDGRMKSGVGTLPYMGPEVLEARIEANHCAYTAACDLWSLGVMTYILLCGRVPFWGKNNILEKQLIKMKAEKYPMTGSPWTDISSDGKHFIQCLLKATPADRLPIERVLEHPWLQTSQQTLIVPSAAVHSVLCDMTKSRASRFSSFCIAIVARQLADKEIKDVFCKLDADHNGEIDMEELKDACAEMFGSDSEQAHNSDQLFRQFDLDGSGKLDYTEFCAAALGQKVLEEESCLRAAFRMFDVHDKDEKITKAELEEVLFKANPEVCGAVARELMGRFDQGNGHLDFGAWANMVRQCSAGKPESDSESRVPTETPSESDDLDEEDNDADVGGDDIVHRMSRMELCKRTPSFRQSWQPDSCQVAL